MTSLSAAGSKSYTLRQVNNSRDQLKDNYVLNAMKHQLESLKLSKAFPASVPLTCLLNITKSDAYDCVAASTHEQAPPPHKTPIKATQNRFSKYTRMLGDVRRRNIRAQQITTNLNAKCVTQYSEWYRMCSPRKVCYT